MADWWVVLSSGLTLLVALFLTGMPIFIGFLVIIIGGVLFMMGSAGFGMVVNSMYDTATTASLGSIPLFILLGEILFRSGCVQVLMDSIDKLVGRIRGRQYVLSIALATVLGALSGSSMAVGAMMGRSLLPAMLEKKYDLRLSVGTILGGACLAPIIPPSILAIIIGTLADVSIASLLIGGVGPGLLLAALYVIACFVKIRLDPTLAPETEALGKVSAGEKWRAAFGLLPFSLIIFMVVGLIMLGIATPSESAATGVVGGLLTAAYYRKLNLRMLYASFGEAAALSAVILLILVSAVMFTQLLAFTGAISAVIHIVTSLDANIWLMLFLMMFLPFVLCMFIDQIGLMLILIPIYVPMIRVLDFDPVWFWVLFLINITLGAITPPFGYVMFALKAAAANVSIKEIFAASWLFVGLTLLGMLLIVLFPPIVTYLPGLLR
ncbi:TRAP transporter large permease subunit [Amorphus sp. 3PC139-8]|uniref:TRAP transporter large permease n=1 Tax=Amorphus sp. 3PC139-8 TaxID=2735676 RepID=UPI00345D69C5